MANKVDFRILKTKEKLVGALISILSDKKLSEITISEVCEEASVNRNTFYSHFKDIEMLFTEVKGRYMEDFMSSIRARGKNTYENNVTYFVEKLRNDGELSKKLFNENGGSQFMGALLRVCLTDESVTNVPRDIRYGRNVCAFILGGMTFVLTSWMSKDFEEPAASVSGNIISIAKTLLR